MRSTFPNAFGTGFWPWLAEHPEERAIFDRAMGGGKRPNAERLAALEWRETATSSSTSAAGMAPSSSTSFDADRDCAASCSTCRRPSATRRRSAPTSTFVAGSFFEAVPTGDAYVLSAIIHDWDDEAATAILRTIRAAAPPHARLLITETVLEPGNEPEGAKWLDLLMLVLAGGRERTEREWRALLTGGGFEAVRVENGLIEARCR